VATVCGSGSASAARRASESGTAVALGFLDERQRLERVDVAREDRECGAVMRLRLAGPAPRPRKLAELRLDPRRRLRLTARRVEREGHRLLRRVRPAEQLARIRDPRVGREIRPQRAHPVEHVERLVVATELDERVAEDAVVAGRVRSEPHRLAAEHERLAEAMAGQRERTAGARRGRIPRSELARTVERLLRLRVVGRVAGLPGSLLVGETEQRVALRVGRVGPQVVHEPPDERRRVPGREA